MSMFGMTVLDACIMRIQVVGETIKSIDDKTKGELLGHYPEIPWKKIVGLRNIISHEYANIDYDVIWIVITKHLPTLLEVINRMKKDLSVRICEE